ncbi:MAG: LamG-like jellyroll fold domain-containing protein [Spirochaetaceae bacterium]
MTAKTLSRVYRPQRFLDTRVPEVSTLGSPKNEGEAVRFDGHGDGFLLAENALSECRAFAIEARFRPAAGGAREQRFFHIQAPDSDDRILLEIRLTPDGSWYADSCFSCGDQVGILIDESLVHALGPWYSYRLSYDGTELRQEIDGVLELCTQMPGARAPLGGITSIGMRATRNHFFCGEIAELTLHSA